MSLGLVADYSSDSDQENEEVEAKDEKILNEDKKDVKLQNFFALNEEEETNNDETNEPKHDKHKKSKKHKKEKLLNPLKKRHGKLLADTTSPEGSVFYNPFLEKQEAREHALEKHVKLSENPRDVLEINGKKMCAAYRAKGRCRFGHNCKFAHDSDLASSSAPLGSDVADEGPSRKEIAASHYNRRSGAAPPDEAADPRKRKPGLARGLLPNKRSRQDYHRQQQHETPWLSRQ